MDFLIILKALKPFRYFSSILLTSLKSRTLLWALAALLLASCSYEDVEVTDVREINIEELNKNGLQLSGSLKVYNPNGYKIKVSSTDADIYLEGRRAGKATLMKNISIPANYDDYIEARVKTTFEGGNLKLLPIILGATVKRSANIRLKGTIRAKSFIISKKFDFDYEHEAEF
jgi:LEA14-like dessication related protein